MLLAMFLQQSISSESAIAVTEFTLEWLLPVVNAHVS